VIKLTKKINGKKIELDLITLKGQAVVRKEKFRELARLKGITKSDLKKVGFGVEE